jgi:endonuclease/exonuclease/phosphatase family metal-dependent hydrolase
MNRITARIRLETIFEKVRSRGLFLALFLLFIFHSSPITLSAQRANVAFWNVENLYDTIPSRFYDDGEWTPRGANRWDSGRYHTKIENIARVIDNLGADIVGLGEVENESVVRDIVKALKTDYNYIHRTSGDPRGIDLALLYKGDKFFPSPDSTPGLRSGADSVKLIDSGMGREFLHVSGELMGERIELIICHLASRLNSNALRRNNLKALRTALEKMLAQNPAANLIVMGDMNATPGERIVRQTLGPVKSPWDFVYTPHAELEKTRQGSYNWRGRWYLYDWMAVSPAIARGGGAVKIAGAGIFAREYFVDTDAAGHKTPFRTFRAGDYTGGYSDHFPVWILLSK